MSAVTALVHSVPHADETNGRRRRNSCSIRATWHSWAWDIRCPFALCDGVSTGDDVACQQMHSIRLRSMAFKTTRNRFPAGTNAVAAVNEQRIRRHPVAHMTAGASANVEELIAHASLMQTLASGNSISICMRGSDNPAGNHHGRRANPPSISAI